MSTGANPVVTGIRIAGDTSVGRVRETNEDTLILEPPRGLYAVLDGMGGANAGDIASQMARDAIHNFVMQKRLTMPPKQLLEQAILAGSKSVFQSAQQHRERHGMGTTCVALLVVDKNHAIVGHVGDSRCYLLRAGRLQTLTRDHTIVEELVDRGLLSADEAERHPYKNVLSRNLGSRPDTRVDLLELEIKPGDRLLLCSDGLYGYASAEAIQYILGSGDEPQHVARDLIDLAMRGGGGDNCTVIVLEAPPDEPTTTQVVRTNGASAWWQKRQKFLLVAKDRGLTKNPIVRGLDPKEALDVVALSLCQAVFHDLEKSTGVNVWTFAQTLAGAWFERGGEWSAVRGMMDVLGTASRVVVDEVRKENAQLGFLLDIAVSRALVVAELALGGLLAEQLRQVDLNLVQVHTERTEKIEPEDTLDTGERFIDRPTIPFLRPDRPVTNAGVNAEVLDGITKTITIARARTSPRAELVKQILGALETIASEGSESFATAVLAARELYGVRSVDEQGILPLFDALDEARIIVAASVHQIQTSETGRAKVLRALSVAHQRLVGAMTGIVVEAVGPFSERLKEIAQVTGELRTEVAKAERKRAELERKFATSIDPSLPWGSRGNTEW